MQPTGHERAPLVVCLLWSCLAVARADQETLYNGIVLPTPWPPKVSAWARGEPVTPPYLKTPPPVIPIDVGRQLFVDDFLVQTTTLKRQFHLPTWHPACPVLKPETYYERHGQAPCAMPFSDGVWWDPQESLFKMWYLAGPFTCLATSRDGVAWTRPDLGKAGYRPGTNIVRVPAIQRDSTCVWLDLEEKDPSRRYKMSYFRCSTHILESADGIAWRSALPGDDGGENKGLATADRTTIFYNPFRKVWGLSARAHHNAAGRRARVYKEAADPRQFGKLDDARWWACADALDEPHPDYQVPAQLYNLDVAPYESLMIGLFTIWQGDCFDGPQTAAARRDAADGRPKINQVKIGFSRDGFHWHRPDRRPFLAMSEKKGDWNWGNVQSVGGGCLIVGDKLYFYCSGRAGKAMPGSVSADAGGSTGLALLRRDGFASMDADAAGGVLTTRPIAFAGRHLFVNIDCPGGSLRVEALDSDGNKIEPFTAANCRPISADSTRERVQWAGADSLESLAGRPVRFRFLLTGGRLYAFWVSPDLSGASFGYVAAGGPGFVGNRDTTGR